MKKNIVFVGNGFDVNLGFATRYSDFYKYLVKNKLLDDELKSFYNFMDIEEAWNCFEENLVSIDFNYVYEVMSVGKFAPAYVGKSRELSSKRTLYDMKKIEEKLKCLFSKWINSIDTTRYFKLFYLDDDSNFHDENFKFNDESVFITFNYTNSLEYIFNVAQNDILHIHGDKNEIIIGCGDENVSSVIKTIKPLKMHPSYESIIEFAKSNKKDARKIIQKKLTPFISKLKPGNIEKIYVLGHSLNKIDIAYFDYIRNKYPNAQWNVSFYKSDEDYMQKEKRLKELGIVNYSIKELSDLLYELGN